MLLQITKTKISRTFFVDKHAWIVDYFLFLQRLFLGILKLIINYFTNRSEITAIRDFDNILKKSSLTTGLFDTTVEHELSRDHDSQASMKYNGWKSIENISIF